MHRRLRCAFILALLPALLGRYPIASEIQAVGDRISYGAGRDLFIPRVHPESFTWAYLPLVQQSSTGAHSPYWPLPANDPNNHNYAYWWVYDWHDGARSTCADAAPRRAAITAGYLHDGAFGDNGDDPTKRLLSISFIKEHPCTYWDPGRDRILREYAWGWLQPAFPIADPNPAFLAFRGDSRWLRGPGATRLQRYPGAPDVIAIPGAYTNTFLNGKKYRYTAAGGDSPFSTPTARFPNYAHLPDRPLDADIVISRIVSLRTYGLSEPLAWCEYYTWDGVRFDTPSGACPNDSRLTRYAAFIRPATIMVNGASTDAIYVGFSEGPDDLTPEGACEEWWFAKDIGPVYIGVYHTFMNNATEFSGKTYQGCRDLLAMQSVERLNNPEAHFASVKERLVGYLKLQGANYCNQSACYVDW